MKNYALSLLVLGSLYLTGCASGNRGGAVSSPDYSVTQYAPDEFRMQFDGSKYAPAARPDVALFRAAEVTLQNGFRYFSVSEQSAARANATPPPNPTPNVQVNNYNYGNTSDNRTGMQWNDDNGAASANARSGLSALGSFLARQQLARQQQLLTAQAQLLVHCFVTKPPGTDAFDAKFLVDSIGQKYGMTISPPAPVIQAAVPR